jgi:hypothetical protein
MNAPWRMSMWLVDGQWARIVRRSYVNTGLQIFTKLIRKAILERFSRKLVTKCQFASKFGQLRVFTWRPLTFLSVKNPIIPILRMRGVVTFLLCTCAVITVWIHTEFAKIMLVIALLKLDFYISDNLLRKMLHFEFSFAECWNLNAWEKGSEVS